MKQYFPLPKGAHRAENEWSVVLLTVVVVGLIIGLFLLELQVPVGVEVWLPSVAVVLLSLWFPYRWQTYLTTLACSLLTLLGMFFSPFIVPTWVAAVNRCLGILVFWCTAWMGLAARRTVELQESNRRLRLEIAERQRGEEKLAEQASLLDLAQDAIMVRDMSDCILFWNHGAERLYGWTAATCGRNAKELLLQVDLPGAAAAHRELVRRGQWTGELRQSTKHGRQITVDSHWTLVRDLHGVPKSVLIVNTDLTEKLKLEAQLLRTQRLESVGVLAGGVAHDFNNLLTPILMAVKLLREERPQAERLGLLATLQASAEHGAEMVRQLLSFAGGVETATAPVQLLHVIKEIKSILDHTFPKTIHIHLEMSGGRRVAAGGKELPNTEHRTPNSPLSLVMGDATQLSQVLMNLCVNARDAMPEGGDLTIAATNVLLDEQFVRPYTQAPPGPYVLLTVSDTGKGIPSEVLDRIFDPFFTTKELGQGTGLGLSTVLGIVRSYGGFVDVFSVVGQGSRFSVYLPAAKQEIAGQTKPMSVSLPRGQGECVLVVDDEPAILETVRATLEDSGFRVLSAADGLEAVALYTQHRQEIRSILLDMMMPGMDGAAVLAAVRQLTPEVRVIASSGLRPTGRLAAEIAAGQLAFLQKPYTNEQLLTTLARTLQIPARNIGVDA